MRRDKAALLRATGAGRLGRQKFFLALHRAALAGLNFGEGDFRDSGELAVLERVAGRNPGARVIFDVGANFGGWSVEAARLWPEATVHSFEPAGDAFARLVAATAGSSTRCVQVGLSDAPGNAALHKVPDMPGLSSLHDRDLSGHSLEMSATEAVPLTTLDAYCEENGIEHIDYLKIDVEGHELAVLRGGSRMLAAGGISAIQFEFGGANIDSRTYLRDFVDLLSPGFAIGRIVRDGVAPLHYDELQEIFSTVNYLAERR